MFLFLVFRATFSFRDGQHFPFQTDTIHEGGQVSFGSMTSI